MASSRTANSRAFSGCSCLLRKVSANCSGIPASEPKRVRMFSFMGSFSKLINTQPLCQATPNQSKLMFRPVNQHRHSSLANSRCSDTAEEGPFDSTASVGCHCEQSILHSVHIAAYCVTSFAVEH